MLLKSLGKLRQVELTEQNNREGKQHRERTPKTCRGSPSSIQQSIRQVQVWEDTSCLEKNHTKELEETVLVSRARNSPCSTNQAGKLKIHGTVGGVHNNLFQERGIIN